MKTYLAIQGTKPFEVLLDIVDEQGATVKHVWRCDDRTAAQVLASYIIMNDAITLASHSLPAGEYELVLHAVERK